MGKKRTFEEISELAKKIYPKFNVIGEIHRKNRRFVTIECSECGKKFERQPNITDLNHDCPYCTGFYCIPGKTDIATTDSWMLEYLRDKDIAYRCSSNVDLKTTFRCPDCGFEKNVIIKDVKRYGFCCPVCSDGITRPNKFLRQFLSQLPVQELEYEYRSEWTKTRFYDAYFEYDGKKYVIEMDGEQHKRTTKWGTKEEQERNDKLKDELARQNDVCIVRIDAPIYSYDYWIEQFKKSIFNDLFDLSKIDWKKCIRETESNYLKRVCEYYENNKDATMQTVAKQYNINAVTVLNYLKIGTIVGWCHYSKEESKERSDRFNSERIGTKLIVYKDNIFCGYFKTMSKCAKVLNIPYDSLRHAKYKMKSNLFEFGLYKFEVVN